MSPPRSLQQQIADVAQALMSGAVRIWRAGDPVGDDARARAPRRHAHHGTLPPARELRAHLDRLYVERLEGDPDAAYVADLEDEIAECRAALAGALVIELARRRAGAVGRQTG
jgi:hypothetical protein